MPVSDFLIILGACASAMLACRVIPVFVLKGRSLPETVVRALNFIPPAAFAALVANDLFNPAAMASGDTWSWLAPLVAAIAVAAVGVKTKSLAWCIVTGVCSLAALSALPAVL